MSKERDRIRLPEIAAIAVYSILSIIFVSFFVILNNSKFILYSFPLFILLSIIIAYRSRLVNYFISASLIMIIAGTLLYTDIISDYLLLYTAAAIVILSILLVVYDNRWRAFNGVITVALLLPVLLYLAKFNIVSAYADNIAIVGYYLLISIVIAMFIRMIDSATLKRLSARVDRFVRSNRRVLVYGSLALGIILILAPIWPSTTNPNNYTKYIQINLSKSLIGGAYYSINFSPYNYSYLLDDNVTNIMFGYTDGVPIYAYISNTSYFSNHSIRILLSPTGSAPQPDPNRIYMYILPLNTTDSHTKVVNSSAFADIRAEAVNATLGRISGRAVMHNGSLPYYVYKNVSSNYSQQISLDPYITTVPICPQSGPTTSNVSFSSDIPVSAFIVYNQSKLNNETVVRGGEQISYMFYMRALKSSSTHDIINADKGVFTDVNLSQSCESLYILTNSTADVSVNVSNRFVIPVQMNRSVEYYTEQGKVERPWFLPSAFARLSSAYSNYT